MKLEIGSSCIGCGKCVKDCPTSVLTLKDGHPMIVEMPQVEIATLILFR